MTGIFPPAGEQNAARPRRLKPEERDYLWFCLEFCDRILRLRPRHVEALSSAANHLTALGYYEDGLAVDRRLAALLPNDPGVLYNLACSLALTGGRDEAIDCLRRAVAAGYDDSRHMAADDDLAAVHGDPRFEELLAIAAEKKK